MKDLNEAFLKTKKSQDKQPTQKTFIEVEMANFSEEKHPAIPLGSLPQDALTLIGRTLSPKDKARFNETNTDTYKASLYDGKLIHLKEREDTLLHNVVVETCGHNTKKRDLEPLIESLRLIRDSEGFISTLENFKYARLYSLPNVDTLGADNKDEEFQKKSILSLLIDTHTPPAYKVAFETQVQTLLEQDESNSYGALVNQYEPNIHFELPETKALFDETVGAIKQEWDSYIDQLFILEKERQAIELKLTVFKENKAEDEEKKPDNFWTEASLENNRQKEEIQKAIKTAKKRLLEAYIILAPNLSKKEKCLKPLINHLFAKCDLEGFASALNHFKTIYAKSDKDLSEIYDEKAKTHAENVEQNKKLIAKAKLNPELAYQLIHNSNDYALLPDSEKINRNIPNPNFISKLKGAWIGFKAAEDKEPSFIPVSRLATIIMFIIWVGVALASISALLVLYIQAPQLVFSIFSHINVLFFYYATQPVLTIVIAPIFMSLTLGIISFIGWFIISNHARSYVSARIEGASRLAALKHTLLLPIFSFISMCHSVKIGYVAGAEVEVEKLKFNPYMKFSDTQRPAGWGYQELKNHVFPSTIKEMAERCPIEKRAQAVELPSYYGSNHLPNRVESLTTSSMSSSSFSNTSGQISSSIVTGSEGRENKYAEIPDTFFYSNDNQSRPDISSNSPPAISSESKLTASIETNLR